MTKVVISSGLRVIRARFGISPIECADLAPADLSIYLSFLQNNSAQRAVVKFPRVQGKPDEEGLVNLKRLGRSERWEFALSVSSLKRSLPNGCAVHSSPIYDDWASRRFSKPPPVSPEYLRFAKAIALEVFPPGWDRSYRRNVGKFVPNASSRGRGFVRGDLGWIGKEDYFLSATLDGLGVPDSLSVQYAEVPTPGKRRALTIPSHDGDLLGPLHSTMYDALRRTSWCLVGPPTDERISSTCVRPWNTSVDLVNASDDLDLDVSHAFIEVANENAWVVPPEIMDFAHASLHADVDGRTIWHGQMMGIYLCFPLLCLHSYTMARWASRDGESNILVNGDDCLINADRPILATDYPPGSRLNDKKTVRSRTVVELNSTVFLARRGRFREVRNLRRGGFDPSTFSGMLSGATAVRGLGSRWVDAFLKARIGKGWGFLPSQLGFLQTKSFFAYRLEVQMRRRLGRLASPLPDRVSPVSDLLQMCSGTPAPDEVAALVCHQWQYGREKKKREDDFNPSRGEVIKTFRYRAKVISRRMCSGKRVFKPFSSYLTHLAELGLAREVSKPVYFVPKGYISMEEERGILDLALWRVV